MVIELQAKGSAEEEVGPPPARPAVPEAQGGRGFFWLRSALLGGLLGVVGTLLILFIINGSVNLRQALVLLEMDNRTQALATAVDALRDEVEAQGRVSKQVISTDKAPAALGPYSQGVRVGDLIFTAGQVGLVPGTREFAGSDIATQTRQALQNLKGILEAGGSCMDHVIKATIFLQDINEYSQMNEVYAEFCGENPPGRSAVQVAALPAGARVEIEMVAVACDCGASSE